MGLARALAGQLSHPSGIAGPLMGPLLDRLNGRANRHAVSLLAPGSAERVLDVGFGGGAALAAILRRDPQATAAGAEISEPMLERARHRFRREIRAYRLQLVLAAADGLPFPDHAFDAALSVHTLYFWPNPAAGFAELHRVLRPGGRLLIAVRRPDQLQRLRTTRHGFQLYSHDNIDALFDGAGFVGREVVESRGVLFVTGCRADG